MRRTFPAATLAGLTALACVLGAPAARAADVSISFEKVTLPNGMVVIFSEDHAVPQVDVNTAFSVGSRVEETGRTGFAHLFEHLMFMGTRRAPTRMFDAWMAEAGGRNNASTREDVTDFYDIAPPTALPLLLWLEADRIRDLGNEIDQAKLDLQREVVLNERRQNIENQPYGAEELVLPELVWPEGHPYHHPVIGSQADLRAARLGDVKEFFSRWYDPSEASMVIAGDFDARRARELVDRWLATLPRHDHVGPEQIAARGGSDAIRGVVRRTLTDDVEMAKVTLAWQSPKHLAPGDAELDLLASALAGGKSSRLYKSMVYDQKIAQSVEAVQESRSIASVFLITALVRPGVDPARVEKAMLEHVAEVRAREIGAEELERARNAYEMAFVERLQSIPERAAVLNNYQVEVGDPGYAQRDLDRYRKATPADLAAYAKKVLLPDSMVILTTVPKTKGARPQERP